MSIKKIDLSTRIFVKKKTDLEVQIHFLSGIRKILLKVHIHQSWWNQIVLVSEALTRTDFDWRQCCRKLCQSATTFLLSTSTLTTTYHNLMVNNNCVLQELATILTDHKCWFCCIIKVIFWSVRNGRRKFYVKHQNIIVLNSLPWFWQ